jgi:hypothetical protein
MKPDNASWTMDRGNGESWARNAGSGRYLHSRAEIAIVGRDGQKTKTRAERAFAFPAMDCSYGTMF